MNGLTLWLSVVRRQISKSRSILIALGICLALLVFIVQIVSDIEIARETLAYQTYGSQHGFIFESPVQLVSSIGHESSVDKYGHISQIGFLINPQSDISEIVSMGVFDEQAIDLSRLELQEGRWPQEPTEIVLEANSILVMRLQARVGDLIELNLLRPLESNPNESAISALSFRLVGIVKNYSYMHFHPHPAGSIQTRLPGAIAAPSILTNIKPTSTTLAIRLKRNVPYFRFFRDMADRFNLSIDQYYLNTAIYKPDAPLQTVNSEYQKNISSYFFEAENSIGYDNQAVQSQNVLNVIIILLVGLTFFMSISTLIIFGKRQRSSVLSLRLAGAAPNQVVFFTVCQIVFYLVFLLPISIAAGLFAANLVSRMPLLKTVPYFQFSIRFGQLTTTSALYIFVLSVVFMVTSYISLRRRPLTTDFGNKPKNKSANGVHSEKYENKPIFLWSINSFMENQLALSSVIITLVLCFSAILISSFLVVQIRQNNMPVYKYDALLSNTSLPIGVSTVSSFDIPVAYDFGFEYSDLENIHNLKNVKKVYTVNRFQINLLGSQLQETRDRLSSLSHIDIESANVNAMELIEKDKAVYGYGAADRIYTGTVIGVDEALMNDLNQYIVSGEVDYNLLNSGKAVILVSRTGNTSISAGDLLTLSMIKYSGIPEAANQNWSRNDVRIPVAAIVNLHGNNDLYPHIFGQKDAVIWGIDAVEIFGLQSRVTDLYIDLDDPQQTDLLQTEMIRLGILYPGSKIYLRSEHERQTETQGLILLGITYGILFLLFCFALFALFSFSQSLAERNRRVIGALRAVGFSFESMKKLKLIESLTLISFAFLLANFLSIGIIIALIPWHSSQLFLREMRNLFTYYPWVETLISLPLMIVATWFFQLLPIRQLYKLPVCDLLRE